MELSEREIWNKCFDEVEKALRNEPIHYRDAKNLEGPVMLKEIYGKSGIEFENGIDELVDLIAWTIEKKGYTIVKKKL